MDLGNRIRTAIASLHTAIEELPLSKAMVQGTIQRDLYGLLLSELFQIHSILERELDSHTQLHSVYKSNMARRDLLQKDLCVLGFNTIEPSSALTQDFCERILDWSSSKPHALLGCLYVFEGSRMGSMYLARTVARALNVAVTAGVGIDYHLEGMMTRPADWQQFKVAINNFPLTEAQADELVEVAVATMDHLFQTYQRLSHVETEVLAQ